MSSKIDLLEKILAGLGSGYLVRTLSINALELFATSEIKELIKSQGGTMLEGKEIDQKFDKDAGEYSVDVDATGKVELALSYKKQIMDGLALSTAEMVELDLISLLRKAEPKVNSPVFTGAVEAIAKALGR